MSETPTRRDALETILEEILPEGLPRPWDAARPLTEAGLDSVAVLHIVGALEERLGLTLGDEDLAAENFLTLEGLEALVERRSP